MDNFDQLIKKSLDDINSNRKGINKIHLKRVNVKTTITPKGNHDTKIEEMISLEQLSKYKYNVTIHENNYVSLRSFQSPLTDDQLTQRTKMLKEKYPECDMNILDRTNTNITYALKCSKTQELNSKELSQIPTIIKNIDNQIKTSITDITKEFD